MEGDRVYRVRDSSSILVRTRNSCGYTEINSSGGDWSSERSGYSN